MSKITVTTIAGQTSGADANTVKIESGDDFAVDTNVLKVDASNNRVGINTTSPSNDLHISSTNPVIRLQDTSTNAYAQIFTNDAGSMRLRADAGNSQASSNFILEIDGTTQLSVDSSGNVLKPNQPSWFQYVIGGGTFSSGWKNVPLNPNASTSFPYHIAGGVTTANSNHEVTVPVAGHYQINGAVTLDSGSVNTDGTLTLSKNNSTMSGGQSSGVYNGALGGTTISYVVELAANDTIGLDYYFSGSATYRNTAYAGYFSGYLLG